MLITWAMFGVVSAKPLTTENKKIEANKAGYRVSLFSDWAGPQLYYKGKKGKYSELEAFRMAYTKKLPFTHGQPITFYTKIETGVDEPIYQPYLTLPISSKVVEPLVVLYWSARDKKGQGQILEFSPTRFKYGSYQVVNLGQTPIIGYVGDKSDIFKCQANRSIISSSSLKNGEVIPIEMITSIKSTRKVVYSTSAKYRDEKRTILFLYPKTSSTQRISYRAQVLEDFSQEPM